LASAVVGVWAPQALSQNRPNRQPRTEPAKPPVRLVIDADVAALEDELAGLMQFRGDMPADQAGRLELLIDLRVLARWFLLSSLAAQGNADLQAAAYLRGEELRGTARTLGDVFKDRPPPTAPQIDAMKKLNQLTFKLGELKSIKQGDELCREVGVLLSIAGGPFPPEVRQIPFMRPPATTRPSSGPASPSADPQTRAAALAVSAPLKRQIQLLAAAATTPPADPADAKAREEAAAVTATLGKVLEMAEGLARNAGVDPAARPQLEQQLTDAVALYADPRLRAPGQQRLAALDAYASSVARIGRMKLKPETQQKVAPALAWAANNTEGGPAVMATVEAFLASSARLDARFAGGTAPQPLPAREAKLLADTLKAAGQSRDQFLAAAGRQIIDPATLSAEAQALASSVELADVIEKLPKSQAAVLAMKPRPAGAVERRVSMAMLALGDPKTSASARAEATRTLTTLQMLADLSGEGDIAAPVLSPDVQRLYAKNQLPALETRRRDVIAELASQFAAGEPLDSQRLLRVQQIKQVRQAVYEAVLLEQALSKMPLAARWVDWAVPADDVAAMMKPYRDGLAAIVEAYATGVAAPPSIAELSARYGPFVKLISRLNAPADASAGLPAGLVGHLGRLMTPLDTPAFSAERYGAFGFRIWSRLDPTTQGDAANRIAESVGKRLE
jgi:hypothetical protein